jgi:Fe-S oxidoreductase
MFQRNHFRRWFSRHRRTTNTTSRGPVVLLDDCLTSYCEPQINRAAVEVLEAAGFEVHLAGLNCCGRTLVSKGFLREAKQLAAANVAKLHDWAVGGATIVGCEPSCLLMLKDDYHDLFPTAQTETVGDASRLIDDFLLEQGIVKPVADQAAALLHGHCHQKALCGLQDSTGFLKELGYRPQVVDSGCCGMAGSFGYEHYDVSMKIGERVLFPAVRAQPDAAIVAAGFSCRQQILHGTGRRALHPVELLK